MLGVSSAKRLSAMPDVPTVAEAGLAGYDATLWYELWAPAGTPESVVENIWRDVARVLRAPDVRDQLAKLGAETMSMTPAQFARFVRAESQDVSQTVKLAGIKPH